MPMQQLQALIQRKIPPQSVDVNHLVELAKRYPQPQSAEYKLIELALNIVLADYLEKAQQHT
jgi:hypothetical protein